MAARSSSQWRLAAALGLVVVNLGLIGLNLAKHDLVTLSFGSSDETEAGSAAGADDASTGDVATGDGSSDGDAPAAPLVGSDVAGDGSSDGGTSSDGGSTGEGASSDGDATDQAAVPPSTAPSVDDWPGGTGPVPDGPPQARLAVIEPGGAMSLTGSAPDWSTVTKIVQYAGEKLPGGPDVVDNQLTWHPDASSSTQWGDVVMPDAATFDIGASEVDPAAVPGLDLAARILIDHPTVFAIVIGHADNQGADDTNAQLAADRAGAVVDYLIAQGVVPGQIVVASAGEDDPTASNETEEGRALNRRAEIQFKNLLTPEGLR